MSTDDLITYDETNKILMSVPHAFDERQASVVSWMWRPNIDPAKTVAPGTEIADIQWDDNAIEPVTAPAKCSGIIAAVNRDIFVENFPYDPPQVLLKIG